MANNPGAGKKPLKWLLLALAMVGVSTALALGTWQLRRAAFKEALASQIAAQSKLPPLSDLSAALDAPLADKSTAVSQVPPDSSLLHRPVALQGTWLHAHTVFLDNRFMAGRAGFYVLTPLRLQGQASVVWVQRGWVARDVQDRTRLPDLPVLPDELTVTGRVIDSISRVYALGEPDSAASAPTAARASRIWQNLPVVDFGSERLLKVAVLQTAPVSIKGAQQPDGLSRDWPQVDAGVAKHYGYAFQWFALCGLIIVLYVWFQILSPRRAVRS